MRSAETSRSAPATDHAGQAGRTVAAAECLSAPSARRVERTVRLVEGRSASSLPHGDSAHEMVDRTRTSLAQLIRGMLIPPGRRGQPLRGAEDTRHHEALLALLAGDPALGVYSPTPAPVRRPPVRGRERVARGVFSVPVAEEPIAGNYGRAARALSLAADFLRVRSRVGVSVGDLPVAILTSVDLRHTENVPPRLTVDRRLRPLVRGGESHVTDHVRSDELVHVQGAVREGVGEVEEQVA